MILFSICIVKFYCRTQSLQEGTANNNKIASNLHVLYVVLIKNRYREIALNGLYLIFCELIA